MSHLFRLPAFVLLAALHCAAADKLLLCGMDEVFAIDADPPAGKAPEKLWSWRAKDHPEIPENLQRSFASTDELKFLDGGAKLLITSSSGGCALVEYPSGKALWYARVPNAHSIESLPGNRAVVASSVHPDGDRLLLFDLAKPGAPLCSTPLPSAHGVIWDAGIGRLWALGFDELRRYEVAGSPDGAASFRLEATFQWKGKDGHDLQAVPGSADLLVTCAESVWLFDRKTGTFRPHPALADRHEVKSVSIHPGTGRTVFTQAGGGEWWTRQLHFLQPESTLTLPDEKLYKVRWFPGAMTAGE